MKNDEKIHFVKDAQYAPIEFEIEDVIDTNKVKVTQTYQQANNAQGGVPSNLAISEYATFDKGFKVDYEAAPQQEVPRYARYEGKILDVQNENNIRLLVVDKSYNEFGREIGAILTGPESLQEDIPCLLYTSDAADE